MTGTTSRAVRVLLVSPDPRTTTLLSDLLHQFGIEVETCTRRGMALHRLEHCKYDGLIVDLLLGDDALELLRSLPGQSLNSGLIACAVLRNSDQKISAFQAGANFVFDPALDERDAWRTISAAYPLMRGERR
jgi:DNA-binding response OmpR family regulator